METENKSGHQMSGKISKEMDQTSKIPVWYNRILLVLISALFAMIGFRNMLHPVENAELLKIVLGSPTAISVARASMGAFPFAFAVILFTSIFSLQSLYRGIYSAFVLISIVTAVRILGYFADGVAPFIAPEIVMTVLSGLGLFLENKRRSKREIRD